MNRLNWQFGAFPFASDETTDVSKRVMPFVDSEIFGPRLTRSNLGGRATRSIRRCIKMCVTLMNIKIRRMVAHRDLLSIAFVTHIDT